MRTGFPQHMKQFEAQPWAVSPAAAAALLGVGRSSVYKLMKRGALMGRKAGRRTVILTRDIERYLEALPALAPVSEGPR